MSIKQNYSLFSNELSWKRIYQIKQYIFRVASSHLKEKSKDHLVLGIICFYITNIVIERLIAISNLLDNGLVEKESLEIICKNHSQIFLTDDNIQLYALVALVNVLEKVSLLTYLDIEKKDIFSACPVYFPYDFNKVDALIQNIPELFFDLERNDYELMLQMLHENPANFNEQQSKLLSQWVFPVLESYLLISNQVLQFPPQTKGKEEEVISPMRLRVQAAYWTSYYYVLNPTPSDVWDNNWISKLPIEEKLSKNSLFNSMLSFMGEVMKKLQEDENERKLDPIICNYSSDTLKVYECMKSNLVKISEVGKDLEYKP